VTLKRGVRTATLVLTNGQINKQFWVPATSTEAAAPPGLDAWAYFPGGNKARLHINGVEQTRYVLAHKNGGPTGLLVRLGGIAKDLGTGGCLGSRLRQVRAGGVGTGGAATDVPPGPYKATFFSTKPPGNPRRWLQLVSPVPGLPANNIFYYAYWKTKWGAKSEKAIAQRLTNQPASALAFFISYS
jgi:hypothetical protein